MRYGVWVQTAAPPYDFGMRTVEEAVSAEDACRIVREELNEGQNGLLGVFDRIVGALPYEEASSFTTEEQVRQAFGWPTHSCDICQSWFVEEHTHAEVPVG